MLCKFNLQSIFLLCNIFKIKYLYAFGNYFRDVVWQHTFQ